MGKSKAKIMCGMLIPPLIQMFKRKDRLVNTFTLRIKHVRNTINVTIMREANFICKVTIRDMANKQQKTFRIQLSDSLENLFFLLSLIRDEYNSKILFTDKSHIV